MALAGALAALTFWIGQLGRLSLQMDTGGFGHDPDYIVEHFRATAYDAGGLPRHVLTASRLVHYRDDDTAEVEAPVYSQYVPSHPTVRVTAKRALVGADGHHVDFVGDVRMVREAEGGHAAMELETEFLRVNPDARRMHTDRAVTVRQGGSRIVAGSMRVEGRTNTILFGRGVRSVYEKAH